MENDISIPMSAPPCAGLASLGATSAVATNSITIARPEVVDLVVLPDYDPADAVRRQLADGLDLHRRMLRDVQAAARVLLDLHASPEARADAHEFVEWFLDEYIHFSDATIRLGFNRQHLARIEPFAVWPAVVAELAADRWLRSNVALSVAYVRKALSLESKRYYVDAVGAVRNRDKCEDGERLPRLARKPAIEQIIVRRDVRSILARACAEGMPATVALLVEARIATAALDVDIARAFGWSALQLEAAQTSWRVTWCERVQQAFITGRYTPTASTDLWKKDRAARSAKRGRERPESERERK